MSTSGIMMMIVLMLCLELIERQELSAAITEVPVEQVEDAVSQLQLEIEELEKKLAAIAQLANTASQMPTSDRKERIAFLKSANSALQVELDRLQGELNKQEQMEPERDVCRKRLKELQAELDQGQRELSNVQRTIQEEHGEDRPLFTISNGNHRQGWIVDVSGGQIQVAPIGRAEKPKVFRSSRKGLLERQSAESAFLEWSSNVNRQSHPYYFLFVRPSGVREFEKITESFKQSGTAYGYDVASVRQTLLHPERGAGQ